MYNTTCAFAEINVNINEMKKTLYLMKRETVYPLKSIDANEVFKTTLIQK